MAPKCNACGRFLAAIEAVTCPKCTATSHRACVGIPPSAQVDSSWLCPECRARMPRANADSTPVRRAVGMQMHSMDVSDLEDQLNTTALDTTVELQTVQELSLDIRTFRENMKRASEECKVWKAEMAELRSFMTSIGDRVTQLEERIGIVESQMSSQRADEGAIKSLETTVSQLKRDLNERDQELLLNDVDIAGIPEEEGESVQHLVLACAAKLGVSLDERDIVGCRRVGLNRQPTEAEPRPRAITVRLARRSTRDQVLKAARVRRSLTTEGLGLRSSPRPMYVNERLTRENRQLFNQARELARKTGWRFVWTREGRVYARQEHGGPAMRIRCEEDVRRVFGGKTV
ncbi:uncharacterized protein LOC114352101 [Ostrinia furnacalis]|uniref:uncharacterized protein LOC114352101 n=1 Tax=Ostrinia furnacalis TaxID=93504 RepID=UPI00103F0FD4|nr:uncharacterized protein LOC114352101 [Ostrinia furnacalis]